MSWFFNICDSNMHGERIKTFEWFKRFKDGRESVEDCKHSGRPSTFTTPEMIAKVRKVILEDRLSTMLGSFAVRF
jgi:hypothetical protein